MITITIQAVDIKTEAPSLLQESKIFSVSSVLCLKLEILYNVFR